MVKAQMIVATVVTGYVGCGFVIGRLHKALIQARREATLDQLTMLPNRTAAQAVVTRALDKGEPVSVGLLDLDQFKAINDCYGHAAGDHALRVIAARLARVAGSRLVARLHGDEFLIVIAGDSHVGMRIAREAWSAVAGSPIVLPDGSLIDVRPSIGVASHRTGFRVDWSTLCRHADLAMYEAKVTGTRIRAREAVHETVDSGSDDDGADDGGRFGERIAERALPGDGARGPYVRGVRSRRARS